MIMGEKADNFAGFLQGYLSLDCVLQLDSAVTNRDVREFYLSVLAGKNYYARLPEQNNLSASKFYSFFLWSLKRKIFLSYFKFHTLAGMRTKLNRKLNYSKVSTLDIIMEKDLPRVFSESAARGPNPRRYFEDFLHFLKKFTGVTTLIVTNEDWFMGRLDFHRISPQFLRDLKYIKYILPSVPAVCIFLALNFIEACVSLKIFDMYFFNQNDVYYEHIIKRTMSKILVGPLFDNFVVTKYGHNDPTTWIRIERKVGAPCGV